MSSLLLPPRVANPPRLELALALACTGFFPQVLRALSVEHIDLTFIRLRARTSLTGKSVDRLPRRDHDLRTLDFKQLWGPRKQALYATSDRRGTTGGHGNNRQKGGTAKTPRNAGQACKETRGASLGQITSRCSTASSSRPSWGGVQGGCWAIRPLDTRAAVSSSLRQAVTPTGSKRLALRDGDCRSVPPCEAVSLRGRRSKGEGLTHPRTRACRAPRRCGSRAAGDGG